jgi:NAD(P)-dependent dehydrogenase (short-subunit alcohol dehydrogenase family)
MRREHFGRIVAVGFGGLSPASGPPYDYLIGKAGRHALIQSIARTEIANGITCNIVAPTHTQRPTMKQAVDAAKHSPSWKRRTSPTPQDGAEAVRFLCSDEAAFVTGSILAVAGAES